MQDYKDCDLEAIVEMLNGAKVVQFDNSGEEEGIIDLSPECIMSAMYYLKSNTSASIKDACEFGLNAWVK